MPPSGPLVVQVLTPPDESALKAFLGAPDRWPALLERARSAPRTRAGVTPFVQTLAALGRLKGRPGPAAMESFERALTIGNLFRLGREAEGVAEYEALLKGVGELLGK